MSFLDEIKKIKHSGLTKTDTIVTTINGLKLKESLKDNTSTVLKNDNCLTFVVDQNPNLEITKLFDYLYLGSVFSALICLILLYINRSRLNI